MAEWLVCEAKGGELFLQSRIEREWMLAILRDIGRLPMSFVVKRFYDMDEAIAYIHEMNYVNSLIDKIKE